MTREIEMLMPYELNSDEIEYYHQAVATDELCGGQDLVSNLILNGLMELWVYNDDGTILVCVTRVSEYPSGYRELLVQMMAGSNVTATMSHSHVQKTLMEYAIKQRCLRMTAYVRPSMWEHFKDVTNYREEYVVIALYPEDTV